MYEPKELLSKIINTGYKIKINYRLEKGRYILFLNYRSGKKDKEKEQFNRRLFALTGTDRRADVKLIEDAHVLRKEFEKNYENSKNGEPVKLVRTLFTDFVTEMMKNYSSVNTISNFKTMLKHVTDFSGVELYLETIDKNYIIRFIDYLKQKLPKSACIVLTVFKIVLHKAIDYEIIFDMPYLKKMTVKKPSVSIEHLTEDEVKTIYHTENVNVDVKNAFVFACFTGLRSIDIRNLKFSDIKDNAISIVQIKTKEPILIPLNEVAVKIINEQKIRQGNDPFVFEINNYQQWERGVLSIIKKAGITKRITGHCSRHSFACNLLQNGVDVLTVSKLMGHNGIEMTLRYLKVVDKMKVDAVNKLSVF